MDVLAFDGRTGAAGDMILGALLAAGADRAALAPVEDAIGVRYDVAETRRHGVHATRVTVDVDGGDAAPRSYDEVVGRIEAMDLAGAVEAEALAVVDLLAEAEASVHGVEAAEARFHEVGADDAVADVVGAALLLDDLAPDRVVTTPVAAGGGEAELRHGTYPVPPPAVVALAERADWSLRGGPVEAELLTPTGAAILAHVAEGVDALPPMRVRASGYGAGQRSLEGRPNVLRAIRGEAAGDLDREAIRVLETDVDDVTPEVLGDLHDALAEAGARDVTVTPLTMKKSRPGHRVRAVARPEDAARVARRLAEETGTLGVRETGAAHRWVADREVRAVTVEVEGERHEVGVKVARDDAGDVYDVSAEYDDAAAVARATGAPLREVMRLAEAAARE